MKIDELIKKQKSGSNVSSSELIKASIELINQLVDTAASINNNVNSFSQQLNKLGSVLSNTKHLNGVGNKLQNLPNLDNIGAGVRYCIGYFICDFSKLHSEQCRCRYRN